MGKSDKMRDLQLLIIEHRCHSRFRESIEHTKWVSEPTRCNADGVPARSDRRGSGAGKDRPKAKGARRSEPVLNQGREEALSKARERRASSRPGMGASRNEA